MPNPYDAGLQALLDPAGNGRGIRILRRTDYLDGLTQMSSYYVAGNVTGRGRARWVDVTTADVDATHNTAVRARLA